MRAGRAKARRVADTRRHGLPHLPPRWRAFAPNSTRACSGLRRDALCELLDAVLSGEQRHQPGAPQPEPGLSPRLGQCLRRLGRRLARCGRAAPAVRPAHCRRRRLRAAGAVGAGWLDLAAPGGQDQSGADLGPLRHRRHAGERHHRRLGVPVAGACCPRHRAVGGCRWRWRGAIWRPARRRPWPSANCAPRWPGAPRTRRARCCVLDSHYDVVGAGAEPSCGVDILARLAANRRFYRHRDRIAGKGARASTARSSACADPTTHGAPDRTQIEPDPDYGLVTHRGLGAAAHPAGADRSS